MKRAIWLFAIIALGTTAWAQVDDDTTLFEENFTNGTVQSGWFSPWEGGDTLTILNVSGNPSGDGWVGSVSNAENATGFEMALNGSINLMNYEISAQIYCTVSPASGPYNGIVARFDTSAFAYYVFRSDFDTNQRLQLRRVVGGTSDSLGGWVGAAIPGGVPTQSSWHLMKLKCRSDSLWVYWDGVELPSCPIIDPNPLPNGFFGMYVFKFSGPDSTLCDDIEVEGELPLEPFDLIPRAAQILNDTLGIMTIQPAQNQTIHFRLIWDAMNGLAPSPPFYVQLKVDNVLLYQDSIPSVLPNTLNHISTSGQWVASVLGTHYLEWTVDPLDSVEETNETNNVLVDSFTVLNPNTFDLEAVDSWIATTSGLPHVDPVSAGETVKFALVWSVPMGSGYSGVFDRVMHLDDAPFFYDTYPGVTSSGLLDTLYTPNWLAVEGLHIFEWIIDSANTVIEFDENNNGTYNAVVVGPPAAVPGNPWNGELPNETRFVGAFPTPFNPTATLRFENEQPGILKITVYDIAGRQITVLADRLYPSGMWEVTWNAEGVAGGMYYAVLEGNGKRSVQPLLLVK